MDEQTYRELMQQDYPKDFAEDDAFTAALLDWSEDNTENKV